MTTSQNDMTPSGAANGEEAKGVKEVNGVNGANGHSKTPNVPVGSISDVKNIYRSPKDKDGKFTWVDRYPEDAEEAAENQETEKYAVLVRNIKSEDSRKKLEAHSIVIQSPHLQIALGHVLEGYTGVACELKRLTFEAPFKPFVHRWTELLAYIKRKDLDDTTREHLTILHDILKYEIGNTIKAFVDYVSKGVITFEHLWMIFQPGSVVLAARGGSQSAFELEETQYTKTQCGTFLRLTCDCVDYSGKEFGRHRENVDIPEFLGAKKITGLNAFPLSFHANKAGVHTSLEKRGELFEKLAGHHYKAYSGTAIDWDREGNEVPIQVDGRIVVDIDSFNKYSPYRKRYTSDWTSKDMEILHAYKAQQGLSATGHLKLTPYYHMLARSRTRGYSLKLKKWLDFFVESITEIQWNTHAFDKLVLPADQKELILAFSESQLEGSTFDDIVSGKGKGIICLLSGPPGVGKTLTAEAVAENLRVPLHTLSSGDLGSQPWEVERGLSRILELVARWNAILLLDECDVFLETRSTHDLERNKVVSIFLRTLEYYEGILFMTTNRVDNIDAAFQSRIHVSLEYPDLTVESRVQIWRNFLSAATIKPDISESEIEDMAQLTLNGRQIKNIIKTAQLLASRKKSNLRKEFIDTVLSIEKRRPEAQDQA